MNTEKSKSATGKVINIQVSDKRFESIKRGQTKHFEFKKVPIPLRSQERLRIGDIIYAVGPDGESVPLEFLTLDKRPDYEEEQVDVIVQVF